MVLPEGSVSEWNGYPTKEALAMLRREAWADPFDRERAALILTSLWEGNTLKRTCEVVGVGRSTVKAWQRLVPEFDALVKEAVTELGDWFRDCAAEDYDPAMVSARLRLAAAYDRRLRAAGGEEGDGGGGSITVQVVKLG